MRRALFLLAVVLWWLMLLAVFVPLPFSAPIRPADVLAVEGDRFEAAIGAARAEGERLHVTAMAGANGALQVHSPAPFRAFERPILRYRFQGLPRSLELVFVFRRADQPDNVEVVTVPGVANGQTGAVDLSRLPAWQGVITEIGFAEFPGAQSVPPSRAFRPFWVERVELQSRSWLGALAVRGSDWFGRQSWELMSLSALGPDSARPRGWPLSPLMFLAAVGVVILGALILRWRGPVLARATVIGLLLAWLALDLRWLHNLHGRHAGTREVYAGLPADERQRLQPDQATYDTAHRIRAALADEAPDTRIFVDAGSDYVRARLLYHLLPLNVAPVNLVTYGRPRHRVGAIVVLFDARGVPNFDDDSGMLRFHDVAMPATPILQDGALRIFRLEPAP